VHYWRALKALNSYRGKWMDKKLPELNGS